jgi:hypothetical protein
VAEGGPRTVAVVGLANDASPSIGRYSGHPATSTTVWEGVSAAAKAGGVTPLLGVGTGASAIAAAKRADVAVVVLTGEMEGESHDRQKLGLPAGQLTFLKALLATKVPLVVCTISGGAVDVSLAKEEAAAVVAMYSGGMEAGAALGDVLFGAVNPSGALAATIYKSAWANASDFLSMAMRTPPGRTHRYLTAEVRQRGVLSTVFMLKIIIMQYQDRLRTNIGKPHFRKVRSLRRVTTTCFSRLDLDSATRIGLQPWAPVVAKRPVHRSSLRFPRRA